MTRLGDQVDVSVGAGKLGTPMPHSDRQVLSASVVNMAIKGCSALLLFLLNILIARELEPSGLGTYAYTMAWVQILAILTQIGFSTSLMRFLIIEAIPARRQEIILSATLAILGAGTIMVLCGAAWGALFGTLLKDTDLFIAALLLIPITALAGGMMGALRGLDKLVRAQLPDQILRPLWIIIAISSFTIFGRPISPALVIIIQTLATAATVAISLWMIKQALGGIYFPLKARPLYWSRQSAPFLLLSTVLVLSYQANIVTLGHIVTTEEIGHYRAAVQFADGINLILISISIAIGPQIARRQSVGDEDGMRKLLVRAHRLGTLALFAPCLALIFWGETIVTVVFGAEFAPAAPALTILALGKMAYCLVGFAGLAFGMMGQPGVAALYAFVALLMNIALAVLLAPRLGITGAAVAVAISEFVVNAIMVLHLMVRRKIDISGIGLQIQKQEAS